MGPSNISRSDDMALLVDMTDPVAVGREMREIFLIAYPGANYDRIEETYTETVRLFQGRINGFQACNTEYHDLCHTTDISLAMARLIHGMAVTGEIMRSDMAELALMSAVLHDTGYIQTELDADGTGAKYTRVHVTRSIEFTRAYITKKLWPTDIFPPMARMILATDLSVNVGDIPFSCIDEERGGKALLSADLIGQISDRIYLEKLLFLYREFSEASVIGFESEKDLLEKTLGFFEFIQSRLHMQAGYRGDFMKAHFRERHGIDRDLYGIAMERNIAYLKRILDTRSVNHREMLGRGGIVKRLSALGI